MRREGWEAMLADYIEAASGSEFVWGSNDCWLWSAGWIRQCTGVDFQWEYLGKYQTERGARRVLKSLGFEDVAALVDSHLDERPVTLARRGDLVLHPQGCVGICNGLQSVFLMESGRTALPTLACDRAWSVD